MQLALYSLQADLPEELSSPTSAYSRRIPPGVSQSPRKITPSPGHPYATLQATGCFPRALLKSSRDSKVFWLVIGVLMTWKGKAENNYNHKISKQFQ